MEANYTLTIIPDGPAVGKYYAQLLPFGNYKLTERVAELETRSCVFDTTGPVYRLYIIDEADNEQSLSTIYFWGKFGCDFFGELLSTGVKVKAKAYPSHHRLGIDVVNLDLTIGDILFKDAEDVDRRKNDFEPWSVAQRLKGLRTHPYSLYNNHNFYTIIDKDNA